MHIHFVIHEVFEGPGAFIDWAKNRGHSIGYSSVYAGEALPDRIERIDLLVVMGGPQSPNTTTLECPYFDAAAEMALIRDCVNAGKAVVGVCLGAQLIGQALGAGVEQSPQKEIGVFPIQLTAAGKRNDKFAHIPAGCEVGHWHNDMPGLTADSKVLAYSDGCPRQVVEYTKLVYGLQCHMEFNTALVELLIEHSGEELRNKGRHLFVQDADTLRGYDFTAMNKQLFTFLDALTSAYTNRQ